MATHVYWNQGETAAFLEMTQMYFQDRVPDCVSQIEQAQAMALELESNLTEENNMTLFWIVWKISVWHVQKQKQQLSMQKGIPSFI